ncbi:MAG: hypothetical protein ACQESF_06430 [Nanobdellota archaeon]
MVNIKKKSQVALFLVVGIVILVAVAFSLTYIGVTLPGTEVNQAHKVFMQACLKEQLKSALTKAGDTGGTFLKTKHNSSIINDSVYAKTVEKKLEKEIDVKHCIERFNNYSHHSASLENPDNLKITLTEKRVVLEGENIYKLIMDDRTEHGDLFVQVDVRLKKLLSLSNELLEDIQDGEITKTKTNMFEIHVTRIKDYLLWIIIDKSSKDYKNYKYRFITRY